MSDKTKLLYELTNCLQPLQRAWKRAVSEMIVEYGISMSLATVIVLIHRNADGMNQKLLADEMGINPGALVRLLDQAAAEQLLERREVAGDRRAKMLHILPKGTELASKVESIVNALRVEIMSDISAEDIERTSHILRLFEARSIEYVQRRKNNK